MPAGLAAEALAMLQAVLADFRAWGRIRTITTLDSRLNGLHLPADQVVELRPNNHLHALGELAARCEAALIIAPESEGILARLSALAERAGAHLLGSSPASVAITTDKWECHRRFTQAGLPTPDTWRANLTDAVAVAKRVGFPLVLKPLDGVGCESVSLVSDAASLQLALKQPILQENVATVEPSCRTESAPTIQLPAPRPKDILLQRYIPGTHASVSLLVTGQDTLPLSLNEQSISVGTSFVYQGGAVPLQHPLKEQALALAQQAVSLAPGLKGYVGVDIILTEETPYLIEINPRLTTSYIGLRQVININLGQAIWQACRHNALPQQVILSGKAIFCKEVGGHIVTR